MDLKILDRVTRRILTMIGAARVTTFNDAGSVQKLQVKVNDLETIDNLVHALQFGFTSGPPNGTDVAIVFIGGDRSNGVVVASNHQDSRPTNLKAGESMVYSQDGKQIYLTASGGIIVNANGQPVEVNNASDVTWNCSGKFKVVAPGGVEFDTPNVASTGDITDNTGSGNTQTMKSMRDDYDEHDHQVESVQTGESTITTTKPSPQV
ncbi:phage baseplate assembly protein V [Burkholderia vietnamiensis]|uniref:phage baseplate assembly protein V n=1 Tax=Burkholderia vietnamiensis TaxID=60552 RepID=UPI00104181BF|nr:phage baseplate assembly protein V [Burkholderia vietnamiensis]